MTDSMCTNLVLEIDALPAEDWPIKNQLAYSRFEDQIHVAVPAWSCRWSSGGSLEEPLVDRVELFATPDDRWQQNEVSQRAGSIVELMENLRDRCVSHFQSDSVLLEATRLPEELTHPLR